MFDSFHNFLTNVIKSAYKVTCQGIFLLNNKEQFINTSLKRYLLFKSNLYRCPKLQWVRQDRNFSFVIPV